ncbi:MAG: gluconolaconase, partial [Betaproteobacteria bacterium]
NHVIRRIAPDQTVSTIAGQAGSAGFVDGSAAMLARFRGPAGIAVDASGQLYISDSQNGAIRMLNLAGDVQTIAGNGSSGDADGAGPLARFFNPTAIVVDAQYNLYVADSGNHKVRFVQVYQSGGSPVGVVQTIAGTGRPGDADGEALGIELRQPYGLSLAPNGDIFVSEAGGHRLRVLFRSIAR